MPPSSKDDSPDSPVVTDVIDPPESGSVSVPASGIGLKYYILLVAAGAFATTFAQQRVLGNYPTLFLLKDHFHFKAQEVATFMFWTTFAWNLKPFAGIFTDAFPLFGTRRRHYMMFGAGLAGVMWLVMGAFSEQYLPLFYAAIAMNVATVFSSTVMGGLMVEAGQAYGAPGRISSLRQFVQSISLIGGPLIGGFLAKEAYGWTTGIAAATVLSLVAPTFFTLREKRVDRGSEAAANADLASPYYRIPIGVIIGLTAGGLLGLYLMRNAEWNNIGKSLIGFESVFVAIIALVKFPTRNPVIIRAQGQLVQIMQSYTLWMAVIMLLLVYTVPGLNTALTYRQTDFLKFDKTFIGLMGSLEGVLGVLAAVAYGLFCRKVNLRILLLGGIGLNAAFTLLYLIYNKQSAPIVHSINGFVATIAELALMDLAVRSTPRGCEALGFSLMMSVRNFGLALSDMLGTKLIDQYHWHFEWLVWVNAGTTAVILIAIPLLPRAIMNRKDAETGSDMINTLLVAAAVGLIAGGLIGRFLLAGGIDPAAPKAEDLKNLYTLFGGAVGLAVCSGLAYYKLNRAGQTSE